MSVSTHQPAERSGPGPPALEFEARCGREAPPAFLAGARRFHQASTNTAWTSAPGPVPRGSHGVPPTSSTNGELIGDV